MKHIRTLLAGMLLSGVLLFGAEPFANNFCDSSELNIPKTECLALQDFYETLNGPNWVDQTGWGVDTNVSAWYGILLNDTNDSVYRIAINRGGDNNLSGVIPESIDGLSQLYGLIIQFNRGMRGPVPSSLENIQTLSSIFLTQFRSIDTLPDSVGPADTMNIILFDDSNVSGSIPQSWSRYSNVIDFSVSGNNLSGPLPDLSGWDKLEYFDIGAGNKFTFSDIEPQIDYIKDIDDVYYAGQAPIDESNHTVYFDDTLRIEPRLALNPSGHDYYIWKKDGWVIEDTRTYSNEDYSASRIYIKENATADDAGEYTYDVNNSRLTTPDHNLILRSSTAIIAIHDNTPAVSNLNPETTVTAGELYSYSATISDADSDDTHSVTAGTLPSWLSLSADASGFTLEGTPDIGTEGDYDINITVTDGKIPVYINYILHVNPSADSLPDGFSVADSVYSHDVTHNSITGGENLEIVNNGLELKESCTGTAGAFASLDDTGALTTGYEDCTSHARTQTLTTPYPNDAHAEILTGSIRVEFPLTQDVTIGGN